MTETRVRKRGALKAKSTLTKTRRQKSIAAHTPSDDSEGVLNDEICCYCGVEILDPAEFNRVLICDSCSGDFHLSCVNREVIPRKGWICPLCKDDFKHFSSLTFKVSDEFQVPKKKKSIPEVLYSPARPLELAFNECKEKGLMLVKGLLSHGTMKLLTHGDVVERTSSGRITESWYGVIGEVSRRVGNGIFSNMVFRDGRFDITLPSYVIRQLGLDVILEPVLVKLRTIMGTPLPQIRLMIRLPMITFSHINLFCS